MKRREFVAILASAAVARPLTAQQKPMPVIGVLGSGSPDPDAPFLAAFLQGLGATGYVEGQNVSIEYRWAETRYERLPALAADLVARKVEVIAALGGTPSAVAAMNATSTIPIIFGVGDPVASGLVGSLAHPDRNLTGISDFITELMPKRLELLSEVVPQTKVIALLVNPSNRSTERMIRDAPEAARAKGLQFPVLTAGTQSEIDAAFATLVQAHAGGLVIGPDPVFRSQRDQLVALASRNAVPTIYPWHEAAVSGGLMSYGASFPALYRQSGIYVGKLLNGAKPADLPVERPTKFELIINIKTARALGLTVPQSLLAQADEVIE